MAYNESGSLSFPVASQAAAEVTYPSNGWDATTTAASSGFARSRIRLDGIVVEVRGTVAGLLTISDHAGSQSITVNIGIGNTPIQALPLVGPDGMETPWAGISAVLAGGSAGAQVRILFRTS